MPEGTRIELLYCDGCPSHTPAGEFLCEALAEVGLEAEVELVAVSTDDEARRLRFPGSPTIRLDGEGPVSRHRRSRAEGLAPRLPRVRHAGGLKGYPTADMIGTTLLGRRKARSPRDSSPT